MKRWKRDTALFGALLSGFFLFAYRGYFGLGQLNQGDLLPLYPASEHYFEAFFSAWSNSNLGFPGSATEAGFFNGLLLLVLGNNSIVAQKVIFLSTMPLACLTMFMLLGNHMASTMCKSLVSFVYGVNPLSIGLFLGGGVGLLTYYSLFPLLFLFLLNILEGKKMGHSAVGLATILAFSASFDVQSPLFFLPFAVGLVIIHMGMKRHLVSNTRMSLMLLASFGVFLVLTLPTTTNYLASLFSYFFGATAGSISNYSARPIPNDVLISRIRDDFSYQTYDFLGLSAYVTGIMAFFALFVRNAGRIRIVLSLLLILSGCILFWQLGIRGSTSWMYEAFPPLFALSTLKLRMILTQTFVLLSAFLIAEAEERGLFGRVTAMGDDGNR